ncbi:DUF4132 domain-containing protein [Actinomadura rudentiformis]|uniref:DUF4132 domain-containing protein n=1 Tax=Actinomadura rudentiformis TaxID=359158 RepID=A0A6H9YMU1_9ACTN|nr:DUF4132 domain-containing protein [Actinomadura rudentiformis]KAB2348264.1 DUF4132 domain-containing protein [Actinomadura rudentiformis]
MTDRSPLLPDEDTLVVPNGWRRRIHPRRGGSPGPKITPDPAAEQTVAGFLQSADEDIERVLGAEGTAPDLAAAARAQLAGEPDPRGAAVLALVVLTKASYPGNQDDLVDAWVSAHGVVFAACALAELCGLQESYEPGRGGRRIGSVRLVEPGKRGGWLLPDGALRVRTLLAAAGDEEYAETVERLAERRDGFMQRALTAYLVPTRQDWVDELCQDHDEVARGLMLSSLGSAHQLEMLGAAAQLTVSDCYYPEVLRSMAEGVGAAVAPLMADALDRWMKSAPRRKGLLEVLGVLPSDEAFRALVERRANKHVSAELTKAMKRFPVRAMRELAAAGATDLLEEHVIGHRELAEAALPTLPAPVREAVEAVIGGSAFMAEAAPGDLPDLLVEPPWARPEKKTAQTVVRGLTVPGQRSVRWDKDEQYGWANGRVSYPTALVQGGMDNSDTWGFPPVCERGPRWEKHVEDFKAGRLNGRLELGVLMVGPDELTRPLLSGWTLNDPNRHSSCDIKNWGKLLAARYELDALPILFPYAKGDPQACGGLLVPFLTAEVAALMASWLIRLKKARTHSEAWFARHGNDAVPFLVPDALGKAGPKRRAAEGALRHLAGANGRSTVVEAARSHGNEAAQAIDTMLAAEQEDLPKPPRLPAWADPAVLPQLLLNGERKALPVSSVRHVLDILALSTPDEPHAGVAAIKDTCDTASLAAFAWNMFERWRQHGERSADKWAVTAVGLLGDDAAARSLTPLIHAWPGQNGHTNAVAGVDALALIGSETALMLLDSIARKAKFGAIKEYAQGKMEAVADRLGLSGEQLADRLVPSFGLDADGGMTLDYGPRRFRVGFDEALRPYVTDEDGAWRKDLPKPGVKDDAALAPAAYRAFGELKKGVRTVAADQIKRLERAMVAGRTWTQDEFGELFVRHPLVWHIARRLVWTCGGVPFRLAEDRTFADVEDRTLVPAAEAVIGLAHPATLGAARDAWMEIFADYELIQPFPQLARPVYELTAEERKAVRLFHFEGVSVPFGKVLGLTRRGWERGEVISDGVEEWISRPLPDGRHLVVNLYPGFYKGGIDYNPEQRLDVVWLAGAPGNFRDRDAGTFGDLNPVIASEILADLSTVTEDVS